jgi:hypothetical protein
MKETQLSLESMYLDEDLIYSIRKKLYHSSGLGYVVCRQFITQEYSRHIFDYWTKYVMPEKSHQKFVSKQLLKPGNPNFYNQSPNGSRTFYNPFWNPPPDEVTHEVCLKIAQLRNQVESRPSFSEIFSVPGSRCVIPRIVITRKGENVLVPHSDYGLDEPNPENIDLRRTQVTLFLSKYGKDYSGSGFIFTTNQGETIQLEKDLDLDPGDLVIWKYSNMHAIESIEADGHQAGFVRILFPPEKISPSGKQFLGVKTRRLLSRISNKIRRLGK